MTGLPEFFKQTSDELYDRHDYKLVYNTGVEEVFDNWESVQLKWFHSMPNVLSHVEVLDKKTSKGFG